MKRLLSLCLTLAMLLTVVPLAVLPAAAAGEDEIPATAIAISSPEELDMICYEYPTDGYYYLTCDIDLTAATSRNGDFYNEGLGWEPRGTKAVPFTGTFNGCGFTISGLTINRPEQDNVGLFGVLGRTAIVENTKFVNANIIGRDYVGIVGNNYWLIYEERTTVKGIESTNSNIYGRNHVGGIIGAGHIVADCTNNGTVSGNSAGGICGSADEISNCQNYGFVRPLQPTNSGEPTVCGIAGSGNAIGCVNFAEVGEEKWYVLNASGILGNGDCTLCANYGDIISYGYYNDTYHTYHGAASGITLSGNVDRCFNAGNVSMTNPNPSVWYSASNYYGALTAARGSSAANVTNSYNCGNEMPLIGQYNSSYITVINCYNVNGIIKYGKAQNCYYVSSWEPGYAVAGTLVALRQLRIQSTFTDWDFDTIWTMGGNEDYLYPELQGLPMFFEKSLIGIGMATDPVKLNYLEVKDELDLTGAQITLKYDNDTTEKIPITADMVSGFDNTKVGKQTITVTYEGFTTSFDIMIVGKSLSSIAVTTLPDTLEYLEAKDTLDVTGGVITLYYNNGTTETKDLALSMVSGFDNTVVGPQELTVTYSNKSTTYDVEIIAKTLIGIEVTKLPTKTSYLEAKDTLNLTGGKLTLYYDNDTTEVINLSEATVTGFNNKKPGVQTLTAFYRGFTATFQVTVVAKSVTYIVVSAEPDSLAYLEAKDELDVTGGQIRVFYDNGTEEVIDMTEAMISGFDNTIVGNQTLTVTYGGKSTVFEIEIIAKTLTGIAIKDIPAKLTYREYKDTLDLTGGRLTLYYNNGTTEVIDMSKATVTGFNNTVIGKQTLTVKYKGFTATFEVEIIAKRLVSISLTTRPTKLIYLEGKDTLDTTGGKLTLYYDNDTQTVINLTADMVSGFDNTKVGNQTLTITYENKTTTYEISVIAKTLLSIAIEKKPDKLTYNEGEALDTTGGKIAASYNNDELKLYDITPDMVTGFDSSKGVKSQTLTVTFGGKTATYTVEILHNYIPTVVDPTCTEQGYTRHTCACGDSYVDTYVLALGHDYIDHEAQAPTCTEVGWDVYQTCSRCDYSTYKEQPALGHDTVEDKAVAPTCTDTGLTAGEHCTRCDYKVAQEEVPALGHDYASVVTEPTCTEGGYTTYTCTRCDDSYVADETAALGHDYVDGICSRCGAEDPDAKDPCEGYTDINRSGWYHSAADFVISRGLMGSTKTDALTFEPDTKVSRAMVASILYRMADSPAASYKGTFTDVANGKWFTTAIEWCAQNGLASGKGNGTFDPNGNVTRQELAVFMMKMAQYLKKDTSGRADLSKFADGASVPSWAETYVQWAVNAGLISGKASGGKTLLAPTDNATRAEFASIIMRFVQNIAEKN